MAKFIPKSVPNADWIRLKSYRPYAVKCIGDNLVKVRLGTGMGLYYTIHSPKADGIILNSISFESGDPKLVAPFPKLKKLCLGRTDECDIYVKHAIVSRKHAEFQLDGKILIVKDLDSTNGTYIYKDSTYFNIEEYIVKHPPSQEGTLDKIHEEFGPNLDDFLIRYKKENMQ